MTDLIKLTISKAKEGLRNKQFSAIELIKAYINQLEKNKKLNAIVTETYELAISSAKKTDQRLAKGESLPLDGIPVVIKDLFCTNGIRTTACSKILENFIPPYESTVTKNLLNDGAILIGKSNCDEFAMGSSNTNSFFGPVINPWKSSTSNMDLVPGGSSGGSAAAVASYSTIAAIGTDTGGSIRQPASFCGIVGLKPTYGRCSRFGIIAFASSLDQAGPLTNSVKDAATMLESIAGYDLNDSTSIDKPVPNYEKFLDNNIKGLKIGVPEEYKLDEMNEEIIKMWEDGVDYLKSEGAEIIKISLPHTKYALSTYYIIAPAEASSNLARYDGVRFGIRKHGETLDELFENSRSEGFGEEVKRRIMIGTYVLSAGYYDAYYKKAQKVRALISQDFKEAFNKVNLIITPTTPTTAFPIKNIPKDPISMYMNDILTVPASLAGLPAISIPAILSKKDGLPLSLQLIASPFDEGNLLRTAQVLENMLDFQSYKKNIR